MSKHILIVEDETAMRSLVRMILEKEDCEVSEAADAAGLRASLVGPAPAAVILDLNLPDGKGLDLLAELKPKWPQTKVIIVTGHGTAEVAEEAYELDPELFLCSKPFGSGTLAAVVELALSRQLTATA